MSSVGEMSAPFGAQAVGLRARGDDDRLKRGLALCLGLIVVVAPILLGANRPAAWLAVSLAISLVALVYVARASSAVQRDRRRGMWAVLIPVALVLGYAAVQTIPGLGPRLAGSDRGAISIAPGQTALGVIRVAGYATLFTLGYVLSRRPTRARLMMRVLFLGIAAHGLWALVSLGLLDDTILLQPKQAYQGFATGSFINRNSFASYAGMGVIIGLVEMGHRISAGGSQRGLGRIDGLVALLGMCVIVLMAALAESGSRAGMASTLVGIGVSVALLLGHLGLGRARAGALAVLGAVFLTIVVFVAAGSSTADRLIFSAVDSQVRFELFAQSFDAALLRPWTGFGLDTFAAAFEPLHQAPLPEQTVWDKPHNSYLTLWVELGFIAGSLPIIAGGIAMARALRLARRGERGYWRAIALCGVTVQLGLHALVDFSLEIPGVTYAFVLLAAIALGSDRGRSDAV